MTKLILRDNFSSETEVVKMKGKKVLKIPRNGTTDSTTQKQGQKHHNDQ